MNWEAIEKTRRAEIIQEITAQVRRENPELFNQRGKATGEECDAFFIDRVKATVRAHKELLPFEREEVAEAVMEQIIPKCLLAVEQEIIDDLQAGLQGLKSVNTHSWRYLHCTTTKEIFRYADQNPELIILSRKLPGDYVILLKNIRQRYPDSRIILLVGKREEEGVREYWAMANQLGLQNVITGPVPQTPGDRPYTLPAALLYDRSEILGPEMPVDISPSPEPDTTGEAHPLFQKPSIPQAAVQSQKEESGEPSTAKRAVRSIKRRALNRKTAPPLQEPPLTPATETTAIPSPEEDTKEATREMVSQCMENPQELFLQKAPSGVRGKLILSSSSKGGVGKTTLSLMMAMALARSGVKVCLMDANFGAPDVATFFKIKGVPGLEILAQRPFSPQLVEDVLVQINDYLYVLPGPMDTTSPYFEPGKLGAVVDELLNLFPVVLVDTPPEFWEDERQKEIFERADKVYSVLTQNAFSEEEAKAYAPKYILFGVKPDQIALILNLYDPELLDPKIMEKSFSANLKVDKKSQPRFEAVLPVNTRAYYKGTHEGKIPGLDQSYSQIHRVAQNIAQMAGYSYQSPADEPAEEESHGILQKWRRLFQKKNGKEF